MGIISNLLKIWNRVHDKATPELFSRLRRREAQQKYKMQGLKVLMKLVDDSEPPLTIWQKGYRSSDGGDFVIRGMTNKDADVITWTQMGVILALIKGQMPHEGGGYRPFDLNDAIAEKYVEYTNYIPIVGAVQRLKDIWEDHMAVLAKVMLEEGRYTEKDFSPKVLKKLKKKGLI